MKRYILLTLLCIVVLSAFPQRVLRTKNFNYKPLMNESSEGVWRPTDTTYVDSAYVSNESFPDNGDLYVPDLEVKFKTVWHDSTIYFLFRRLDDVFVNGYNFDDSLDESLEDSLVNRDATALYFYFSGDSSRLDTAGGYNYFKDTIAWMRFVWDSDTMEGQLPGGEVVHTFEEMHSEIIQWDDGVYKWAKLSVNIGKLAPHLFYVNTIYPGTDSAFFDTIDLDTTYIGFELEINENDKEYGPPYAIQTRANYGYLIDENVLEDVSWWSWLYFVTSAYEYEYVSSVNDLKKNFANIYPNPATQLLNISLDKYDKVHFSIIDITGRTLIKNKFEGNFYTVELTDLKTGVYYIRLERMDGIYMTRRIIVIE